MLQLCQDASIIHKAEKKILKMDSIFEISVVTQIRW